MCGRSTRRHTSWGSSSSSQTDKTRLPSGSPLVLGYTLYYLGDLLQPATHRSRGLLSMTPRSTAPLPSSMGLDPGVACLCYAALDAVVSWLSGPGPAEEPASSYPSPGLLIPEPRLGSGCCCLIHQFRRERQAAHELAEAAITSTEQGFPHCWRGGYPARLGASRAGTSRGRNCADNQGLTALRATGAEWATVFSRPAGRGVWESGAGRGGLAALAEALASYGQNRGALWEAELYRPKGELTLRKSRVGIAAGCNRF